jgi:LPS-assembly protein
MNNKNRSLKTRISALAFLCAISTSLHANPYLDVCAAPAVEFKTDQLMPVGQIKVSAQQAELISDKQATFSGDVEIISNTATINAKSAQVLNSGKQVVANGDVAYQDAMLNVASDSIDVNSDDKSLLMVNTEYQLTGLTGRGKAETIDVSEAEGITLNSVSFSTCPLNKMDWQIRASEISLEEGSTIGEALHTRFYVKDVPVFYLPYFAFPVGTERQSGLLFPNITSSTQAGIDYDQPIYWNIAPNYDLTFTPRLMTRRGLQLNTEFRYLTESSQGNINIEYLSKDRDLVEPDKRYFYRFFHEQQISDDWFLFADVNGLSDNNYIVDLGSQFFNRADTHVVRTFGFDYLGDQLNASIYLRDFDNIGEERSTYRALPEIKINGNYPLLDVFEFQFDSELAYFDNSSELAPRAARAHFAPTFRLPYRRQWGELGAEATWFSTYYNQENLELAPELEEDVRRNIGQARLYGTLYFERPGSWLGKDTTMTLEPRLQYLYTSYENQDNIGLYDATALLTDVEGLFRGREFTGLDRISDNNQVTFGVTSRVIDSANREQFVLSIGQTFYFERGRVATFRDQEDRSQLAGEIDWRISSKWLLHSDMQLATSTQKVDRSGITLEYNLSAQKLIQFSHRFVRNLSGETIDQLGVSASWPINKNWQWVGRVFRDIERDRSVESYMGLEYESCCWALRFVAQRHLSNRFDNVGTQILDEYDSGIAVRFVFKGMGTSTSNRQMLEDGMFGYRQPYSLN